MNKECSKCKESKPIENFKKKSGKASHLYFSYCIDCKREYDRNNTSWKLKNDKAYAERIYKKRDAERAKYMLELKTMVTSYQLKNPCVECGEANPEILDFDHKERYEKEFLITDMVKYLKPKALILAEIAKCDVRCGNCHRHKTMHETGSWRAAYCTKPNCQWEK